MLLSYQSPLWTSNTFQRVCNPSSYQWRLQMATIHFHNIKKTNIGRMESEVGVGEEQFIKWIFNIFGFNFKFKAFLAKQWQIKFVSNYGACNFQNIARVMFIVIIYKFHVLCEETMLASISFTLVTFLCSYFLLAHFFQDPKWIFN